jgi:CRAL/TRIO domain
MDPVTAAKVMFVNKGTLPDHIPLENLPAEYGGSSTFQVCSSFIFHNLQ